MDRNAAHTIVTLALGAGLTLWHSLMERRAGKAWGHVAAKLDLSFQGGSHLHIEGERDGYTIGVQIVPASHIATTVIYARYRKPLDLDLDLLLRRQSLGGRLTTFEDHKTGDVEFDQLVIVQSYPERRILRFLTNERRLALKKFFRRWDEMVKQEQVEIHFLGATANVERLVSAILDTLELAQALTKIPPDEASGKQNRVK